MGAHEGRPYNELYYMTIFYCQFSEEIVLGSTNRRKIRNMITESRQIVRSCDIAKFNGQLLSAGWIGPDNEKGMLDFNHGYKDFAATCPRAR